MAEFSGSYAIWAVWIALGLLFSGFMVMSPCHAVFLFPFVALPAFWLLPPNYAIPLNIVIWLATPYLFRAIRGAMKKPIQDGFESLIGARATVISKQEQGHSIRYLVRANGASELWSAYSVDVLQPGDPVNIVETKGISMVIERAKIKDRAEAQR